MRVCRNRFSGRDPGVQHPHMLVLKQQRMMPGRGYQRV
jgi:hypothetical protein